MFDVSFSELVLIVIVGLVVFGPEKLPEVVRTAGLWLGKLRRSFNNIRSEIEREVGFEELKRDLHNQQIMDSLKGVQDDLRGAQQELQKLPHEFQHSIDSAANSIGSATNRIGNNTSNTTGNDASNTTGNDASNTTGNASDTTGSNASRAAGHNTLADTHASGTIAPPAAAQTPDRQHHPS